MFVCANAKMINDVDVAPDRLDGFRWDVAKQRRRQLESDRDTPAGRNRRLAYVAAGWPPPESS